jgi:hypothetical protein
MWTPVHVANIDTIEKNTEILIDASKEVCLEINVEKTKYMIYLDTRMQVKIGTYEWQIDRLKMCHRSNIWGQQ